MLDFNSIRPIKNLRIDITTIFFVAVELTLV